jgi:hypothetical protein
MQVAGRWTAGTAPNLALSQHWKLGVHPPLHCYADASISRLSPLGIVSDVPCASLPGDAASAATGTTVADWDLHRRSDPIVDMGRRLRTQDVIAQRQGLGSAAAVFHTREVQPLRSQRRAQLLELELGPVGAAKASPELACGSDGEVQL